MVQYMTRCPFSLSRLVKVTKTGQVVYKAEKDACRAFPDPQGDGLAAGPKRNFQILAPLDFLAEFTQHIPPKGAHLIRYYGWYSNKARGLRRKAAPQRRRRPASAASDGRTGSGPPAAAARPGPCSSSGCTRSTRWPVPSAAAAMKVVAFIEPPQGDVIEKILRHCGLWHALDRPGRRPPGRLIRDPDGDSDSQTASSDEPRELTYVDIDTFEATF